MVKLDELDIEKDGSGFAIKSYGIWYNINGRLEDVILGEKCLGCPKTTQEACIVLGDRAERGAFCEVNADAVRQSHFADSPMPPPELLLKLKCEKEGLYYDPTDKMLKPNPPKVAEEPAQPAPESEPIKKATIVSKVKEIFRW
jgi:hypothetical protein